MGASFPQSSVPHAALAQAAEVVGQACFRSGVIGYVGVDFLALREEGNLRLWAVQNMRSPLFLCVREAVRYVPQHGQRNVSARGRPRSGLEFGLYSSSCRAPLLLLRGTRDFGWCENYSLKALVAPAPRNQRSVHLKVVRDAQVDLNLHLTSTQASFQMFDFVCHGSFNPKMGSYTVEIHPEEEVEMHEDGVQEQAPAGAKAEPVQERRFYAMTDYISHASLANVQYTAFFNRCRLDGESMLS